MKKSGKLLAALFLFSTILAAPITSSIAYADETATEGADVASDSDESGSEVGATGSESENTESEVTSSEDESATTTADAVESSSAEDAVNVAESNDTTPEEVTPALTDLEQAQSDLTAKIAEANALLASTTFDTYPSTLLSTAIAEAQAVLDNSASTVDELNAATDNLNTIIYVVTNWKGLFTPSIEATDQTMYVGDVISQDLVMGWATFTNAEYYANYGFEVIGGPIYYTIGTNELIYTGTYTIRYFVEDDAGTVIATKDITLTVLDRGVAPSTDPAAPLETKVVSEDPAQVATPKTELPKTGETNSATLVALGGASLLATAYALKKRKIEE